MSAKRASPAPGGQTSADFLVCIPHLNDVTEEVKYFHNLSSRHCTLGAALASGGHWTLLEADPVELLQTIVQGAQMNWMLNLYPTSLRK